MNPLLILSILIIVSAEIEQDYLEKMLKDGLFMYMRSEAPKNFRSDMSMRFLCLLILIAVCIVYVSAQWGMGPYYGPVGPFGGTPYAHLRAMSAYGMMPYRGFGFG